MQSVFDRPSFSSTLFFPSPRVSSPPANARDLRVEAAPGVSLHVRLHGLDEGGPVLLLFHGNGELVADYDRAARRFADAGVSLAVTDFRGYGASEGSPSLRSALADAGPVLDAVREATRGRALVVMGRSLGSCCAAELCQTARPEVRGYVFESAIADVYGLVRRRGVVLEGPLDEAELAVFDPLRKYQRCTTPALVLHGADDTLITADEARSTFGALATPDKELVLLPGRGHNDLSAHPLYWDALARFVKRVAVAAP